MYNHFPKNDFSSTAKKIKKELEIQLIDENIKHSKILNIIIEKASKNNIETSLKGLLRVKKDIQYAIKELYGVMPEKIQFIDMEIKRIQNSFYECYYNYNLPQYIQDYNILKNKKEIDIITYEDAFNYAEHFANIIFEKYYYMTPFLINDLNNKLITSNDIIKYNKNLLELYIILKKEENNKSLSYCDEFFKKLIKNILDYKMNHGYKQEEKHKIEEIKESIQKEIIKTKNKLEEKLDYRQFLNEITPYNYETPLINDIKELERLQNKIKENQIYLGEITNRENTDMIKNKEKISISRLLSFNKDKDAYLKNEELKDGVYISMTAGSGGMYAYNPLMAQRWINGESNIIFDFFNDKTLYRRMQKLKNLTDQNDDVLFFNKNEFLKLNKEQIESYLSKNKSILFSFSSNYLRDDVELTKIKSKLNFTLEIIGKFNKTKDCNILINEADFLFNKNTCEGKKLIKLFETELRKYIKTNLFLMGSFSTDKEFLKNIKTKIIMKTEMIEVMDILQEIGFDSNEFNKPERIIRGLFPGEFILIVDNKLVKKDKIMKFHYLNVSFPNNINLNLE